jgi:hypothetical protein
MLKTKVILLSNDGDFVVVVVVAVVDVGVFEAAIVVADDWAVVDDLMLGVVAADDGSEAIISKNQIRIKHKNNNKIQKTTSSRQLIHFLNLFCFFVFNLKLGIIKHNIAKHNSLPISKQIQNQLIRYDHHRP